MPSKKEKKNTSKGPDPKSTRSKKRANRGFRNLETSTRKGKRAERRSLIARTVNGTLYPPGTKVPNRQGQLEFTAGGSRKYHVVS